MNAPHPRLVTALHALSAAMLAAAAFAGTALAQNGASVPGSTATTPVGAPIAAPAEAVGRAAPVLAPFTATYEAFLEGKHAGNATMRVVRGDTAGRWRVDLDIKGDRGFAGILGLNLQQSTVFESGDGGYRPISQSTVRKGLFLGKKIVGVYDWSKRSAQWSGDIKAKHRAAIPLRDGDMSGLLINLAIVRDAQPDRMLQYRFVDGGRARDHQYHVGSAPEPMAAGELSFETLRVARTNGGNDETLFWVADGVPTPVRILQREDGEDAIDLRLIQYEGQ